MEKMIKIDAYEFLWVHFMKVFWGSSMFFIVIEGQKLRSYSNQNELQF